MATTQSVGLQRGGLTQLRPPDYRGKGRVPPVPRKDPIQRQPLVDTVVGTTSPIVVISAPTGYGKTTLLAQVAGLDHRPIAWVTCTDADNDPASLRNNVGAALERCSGEETGPHGPVMLIVDDAHLIAKERTLDALLSVPDDLPPGSTVVIATRAHMGGHAARMRSQGRIHDVGTTAMAMDADETGQMLRAFGLDPSEDAVAALTERTEGWPAALSLAAVAAREHEAAGLEGFGTDDRFMADYLRSEFFERMPEHGRFLTQTSVLGSMSGPLCDAVLATTGSASVLATLVRSNGLVTPSSEPGLFRYHPLYRKFLLAELNAREPDTVAPLNAKAARWLRSQGKHAEAIGHAFAAGEPDLAADSMSRCGLRVFWSGGLETVRTWLAQFEDGILLRWPSLAVEGAWVHALIGNPAEAYRWMDLAERGAPNDPPPDGSASVAASIARIRAMMCRAGVDQMRHDAELACAAESEWSAWRASSLIGLGVAHALAGDLAAAERIWHEATEVAREVGAIPGHALALSELAREAAGRGAWTAAAKLADEARSLIDRAGLHGYATSGLTFAVEARVALREGFAEQATEELDRTISLLPLLTHALPWYTVQVRLEIGWASLTLSRREEAVAQLREIDAIVWKRPGLGSLIAEIDHLRKAIVAATANGVITSGLTPAELRLLPLLPTHLSFADIGERLFVSRSTVKTQAISIYRKLGVSSRGEAVEQARSMHLLDA